MTRSIILPAKNEAPAIGKTLKGIASAHPDAELIVVDDGSADETATIARAAGARVVSHACSRSYNAAVKSGARAARGEVLVFMDADGQHDLADIKRLLEVLEQRHDMGWARQKVSQASLARAFSLCSIYLEIVGHARNDRMLNGS